MYFVGWWQKFIEKHVFQPKQEQRQITFKLSSLPHPTRKNLEKSRVNNVLLLAAESSLQATTGGEERLIFNICERFYNTNKWQFYSDSERMGCRAMGWYHRTHNIRKRDNRRSCEPPRLTSVCDFSSASRVSAPTARPHVHSEMQGWLFAFFLPFRRWIRNEWRGWKRRPRHTEVEPEQQHIRNGNALIHFAAAYT